MQQAVALLVGGAVLVLLVAALRDALFTTQRDEFERGDEVRRRRESALLRVGVLMVPLALLAGQLGGASSGPSVQVSIDAELREELADIATSNRDLAESVAGLRSDLEQIVDGSAGSFVTAIDNHAQATAKSHASGQERIAEAIDALGEALATLELPAPVAQITVGGNSARSPGRFRRIDLGSKADLRVPFGSNEACVSDDATADTRREVVARLVDTLDQFVNEGNLLLRVEVVGRFDHRPLTGNALAIYGGNSGLAQARADCVADDLRDFMGETLGELPNFTIDTRIAGPRHTGDRVGGGEDRLAFDRSASVIVFMLAPVKQGEQQ